MTEINCNDPAADVIAAYSQGMREAFDPAGSCPPVSGSTDVRFVAGESVTLDPFDKWHKTKGKCAAPMLWVRLARRYRTKPGSFPAPMLDNGGRCDALPEVIALEIGVARCSVVLNDRSTWDDYEREAQQSLDDSWRIKLALCKGAGYARAGHPERLTASDVINPAGPDGGVIAWISTAYIQL